jgi:hypothetical protein
VRPAVNQAIRALVRERIPATSSSSAFSTAIPVSFTIAGITPFTWASWSMLPMSSMPR